MRFLRSPLLALLVATLVAVPGVSRLARAADVRIDQLPAVSGSLTGTETIPILVGPALKSATTAQLTAITTINWRGAWNSGTAYVKNDAVSHSGSSYIALTGSTNQTPPNATYWNLIASQGSAGPGTGSVTSVTCGTGLSGGTFTVTGTCAISAPVAISLGGTGATSGSGTVLDNLSGFSCTGLLVRSGAGSYSCQSTPIPVASGGTGQTAAGATAANNIGALARASNLSDLINVGTARTNLGLGTIALLNSIAYADIASGAIASSSDWLSNTGSRFLTPNAVWSGAAPAALTDSTTIALDFASGVNFSVTLAGNRTLGAPTNVKPGQSGVIRVLQDGTGSRTLSYNSVFKWPAATACVLTTTANRVDYLSYYAFSSTEIMLSCIKDVR